MKRTKQELGCCHNLRLLWCRSPLYWAAMQRVKLTPNQYKCEGCSKIFKLREVNVDHIEPVVDVERGWESLQVFAFRLFCPSSQLQVLCIDNCHLSKSKNENKVRRENK